MQVRKAIVQPVPEVVVRESVQSRDHVLQVLGQLAILGVILIVAAGFRFYGLAWDRGYLFHPDERKIILTAAGLHLPASLPEFFSSESPLNPKFFAYGSLPIYLIKLLSPLAPVGAVSVPLRENSLAGLALMGRVVSGLFDLGTIVLIFLLGRRLYNAVVGLMAAACVALAVLHIQLSHFYAVDTLLTFFVVATLYFGARLGQDGKRRDEVAMAILFGAALATKATAAPLIIPIVVAVVKARRIPRDSARLVAKAEPRSRPEGALTRGRVAVWREQITWTARNWRDRVWAERRTLAKVLGIALVVFVVTQPYFLLDPIQYFGQVGTEALVARGWLDYPYTRQYAGRIPFLYQIIQSSVWGMGLPLGLFAWLGSALFVWQWWRKRDWESLFVLSWALVYFFGIGAQFAKYLRYLLPLIPFLALMASAALQNLLANLRLSDSAPSAGTLLERVRSQRLTYYGLEAGFAVVLVLTLAYATAFDSLYSREHPWLQISQEIYNTAPAGSTIADEHWDDVLPVAMQDGNQVRSPSQYKFETLPMYDPDTPAKVDTIAQTLVSSDYIVLASQRLYGAIARLPARYPMSSRYYHLLFAGKLGFQLVALARGDMSLAGITIADDTLSEAHLAVPPLLAPHLSGPNVWNWGRADESFTVYDHPMPLLFKKTRALSAKEIQALLSTP
ncbi:MAG: glycosyltransferase family 39 protein [Chloroflexi bacterium]|nr:glycosyltransferase family 39 protein [Chloroflexota bacterium]